MIRTIKTGVAAVLLILATSCKKRKQQHAIISHFQSKHITVTYHRRRAGSRENWHPGLEEKDLTTSYYANGDKIPQVKTLPNGLH